MTSTTKAGLLNQAEEFSQGLTDFLGSRFFLQILTIAVAVCTSSFAAQYGEGFDWRYMLLFGIALAALTFYFAKLIPSPILWSMKWVTIIGLITFTLFVGAAAWLSVATSKTDPEIVAVNEEIESYQKELSDIKQTTDSLMASGNPVNSRLNAKNAIPVRKNLSNARKRKRQLMKNKSTYESGSMAIFGHIKTAINENTNWKITQDEVDLLFMGWLLFVLVCMEISIGAAATDPDIFYNRKRKQSQSQGSKKPFYSGWFRRKKT